jgi:DNA-binding MarR family transcriptional regulator
MLMKNPNEIKETVSKWFKEDEKLLSDVHYAQDVIRIIEDLSKKGESIAKNIIRKSGITKTAVCRKTKRLLEDGLITQEKGGEYYDRDRGREIRDGRIRTHHLTEKGQKIADYLRYFPLPAASIQSGRRPSHSRWISTDARVLHSVRLRELLEEMVNQIPIMSSGEVHHSSPTLPWPRYDGENLSIENEILFSDLENHLVNFEAFDKSYSEFKESCKRFRQLKERILREIALDVSKNFGLRYSPHWNNPDSFSPGMVEWIFEAGALKGEKEPGRLFKEYYLAFESEVRKGLVEGEERLEYWVGGTGFIEFARGHGEAETLRKEIDDQLEAHLEGLEDTSYYREIVKACDSLDRAARSREDLVRILMRNLEIPIFRGRCPFLDAQL